ncbi:TraY domain-containing protein [Photobacterium toruni]|uniref:TraY domain-containing protein n=1 Tax=Photobacterium toruni TaxID=1935446 RepID=UPI002E178EB5|nr:TraY domain-containing protein [Photobacterium toruni]
MPNKTNEKFTNVNVSVGEKGNKLLNIASQKNHRSKRKEAAARLEHHLRIFGTRWTGNQDY